MPHIRAIINPYCIFTCDSHTAKENARLAFLLPQTGRMITVGEYAGIKGFRNVYENLELEFKDEDEARNILELARYANVHTQKPLTDSELRFIYFYPNIAAKIMTVEPYYMPLGALKERMERLEEIQAHRIV